MKRSDSKFGANGGGVRYADLVAKVNHPRPKSEGRIPKSERSRKVEIRKRRRSRSCSGFGFRISTHANPLHSEKLRFNALLIAVQNRHAALHTEARFTRVPRIEE